MKYKISIDGCDDSTEVVLDLTKSQVKVIEELAEKASEVSTYGCMPTIAIIEPPTPPVKPQVKGSRK
jgi:hypothetical protein